MPLLALAFVACGSDDGGDDSGGNGASGGGSDEEQVESVAQGYEDALDADDLEGICASILPSLLRQSEKASGVPCTAEDGVGGELASGEGPDLLGGVESVIVEGDVANATFKEASTLLLKRERGQWYVDLRSPRPDEILIEMP